MSQHVKTEVPELKYTYKWTIDNFCRLSYTGHESPSFCFNNYNWYFKLFRNKDSVFIRLTRSYSGNILIKSRVCISDSSGSLIHEESHETQLHTTDIEVARLGESSSKKLENTPDDVVIIAVDLVLYKIVTYKVEDVPCEDYHMDAKTWLCEDLLHMFNNKVRTDVVLNVNGEKIKAHKFVLCARSPVFAKMFEQDMAEASENTVDIADVKMAAMKVLVDFMYSRVKLEYDFETAMDVYYAADKYEVMKLRTMCGKTILRNLNQDNAVQLLLLADRHQDKSLKESAMKFISANFKACVGADWWIDFASKKFQLFQELMRFCD